MELQIIYEDNHLLIVNKPFGELVHFDKTGDTPVEVYLKTYLKNKYNKPGNVFLRAVHRLDRPVTGVLLFARTSKGLERMARLFKVKKIKKTYWALSPNLPSKLEDRVVQHLLKDRKRNIVNAVSQNVSKAREAITDYRVMGEFHSKYLFELKPVTGRSHQLRVLMRSLGCPIIGDLKYDGNKMSNGRAIMLHARQIEFIHPVSRKKLRIRAPLPDLKEWRGLEPSLFEEEE